MRPALLALEPVTIARWQFGITTVYHFLFVPLTLGMAWVLAVIHTAWYRTGDPRWLRQTKFWGKLFLVNFAIGVATGIVQEFQFGMAWSAYSRFVGDVFGAPLAMEALAAFFLESTFLGLWIFGWDRLPPKVHLATIWLVAFGTNLSAYFILAANSWMQHPVGVRYNPVTHRAELVSIFKVLGNSTLLAAFPHTLTAGFMTAGAFVGGISAWQLHSPRRGANDDDRAAFRTVMRGAMVFLLVGGLGVAGSGHLQARLMIRQQPMKMAAAEALCNTTKGAGFSILAYGDVGKECSVRTLDIPGGLSFLANDNLHSTVKGVHDLQAEYTAKFGPANYRPNLALTYWSFRLMIGFGMLAAAVAAWALWRTRGGRTPTGGRFTGIAVWGIAAPFLANTLGWIFTEMGRQPWVVAPNPSGVDAVRMFTAEAVSGSVSAATMLTSVIVFTLLYGVLAVVEMGLMVRTVRGGPDGTAPPPADQQGERLSFAY